jgi:hypothetical protein
LPSTWVAVTEKRFGPGSKVTLAMKKPVSNDALVVTGRLEALVTVMTAPLSERPSSDWKASRVGDPTVNKVGAAGVSGLCR